MARHGMLSTTDARAYGPATARASAYGQGADRDGVGGRGDHDLERHVALVDRLGRCPMDLLRRLRNRRLKLLRMDRKK